MARRVDGAVADREGETALTNVFFHIGMHKTATTWFQHQLFPNLKGVQVLHMRHVAKVPIPDPDAPTLIVSHAGLSATLSVNKTPGTNSQWLADNLRRIQEVAPDSHIIIGFREQRSWLHAAYCNKAKKTRGVSQQAYVATFSLEDLSWCQTLRTIERSSPGVFPFLYEELLLQPHVLIEDLCSFIVETPPKNLDQLLTARENPSPRSHVGQLVAQSLYALHYASGRMIPKSYSGRIGARFDRYFPTKPMVLDTDVAAALQEDWNDLKRLIGERRSRDFSALSRNQAPRI